MNAGQCLHLVGFPTAPGCSTCSSSSSCSPTSSCWWRTWPSSHRLGQPLPPQAHATFWAPCLSWSSGTCVTSSPRCWTASSCRRISFVGCMTQLYFFSSLVCTECVLLASAAYDRYVAICHPLRYQAIMTTGLCVQLVAFSFVSGFTISVIKVYFISSAHVLWFQRRPELHFFCDISPIPSDWPAWTTRPQSWSTSSWPSSSYSAPLRLAHCYLTGHVTLAVLCMPSARAAGEPSPPAHLHLTVVTHLLHGLAFHMHVRPRPLIPRSSTSSSLLFTLSSPQSSTP